MGKGSARGAEGFNCRSQKIGEGEVGKSINDEMNIKASVCHSHRPKDEGRENRTDWPGLAWVISGTGCARDFVPQVPSGLILWCLHTMFVHPVRA
jgi:hypothetical protein